MFATSCEGIIPGGLIVDWTPVEITIEAYDAAGNMAAKELSVKIKESKKSAAGLLAAVA